MTIPNASSITEQPQQPQQPCATSTGNRSRNDSSTAYSIDPFHYQALQDTNEALKSEVHRLARADEENTAKLKLQVCGSSFFLCWCPNSLRLGIITSFIGKR